MLTHVTAFQHVTILSRDHTGNGSWSSTLAYPGSNANLNPGASEESLEVGALAVDVWFSIRTYFLGFYFLIVLLVVVIAIFAVVGVAWQDDVC